MVLVRVFQEDYSGRVAEPVGEYPDLDPTSEKNSDPDPTLKKISDPDPNLDSGSDIIKFTIILPFSIINQTNLQ